MKARKGYSQKATDESFEITDRTVKGYFASFGNIDSDNDMFIKGAFAKSIQERGVKSEGNRKIAHLAFHDMNRPIGTIKTLEEDSKGLFFESVIGTHTDGEDMLKMYNEGIIREHSVGFQYMPDKMEEKTDFWELKEVKLWEGSAVTFGANSETPVIKSEADYQDSLNKIAEDRELLFKLLKGGKSGDLIELEFRKLCYKYETLCQVNPFERKTVDKKEPFKTNEDLWREFYINS